MSSIWSSAGATAATVSSPFATTGIAPSPGGGGAAKFQSLLQSAQKTGQPGVQSASNSTPGSAASPKANDASSSTGSAGGITANDFLTLLVTEMQNQDPTSQTDPNEYINQLTQINSLEQLISINQNLEIVLGAAAPPTGSASPSTGTAESSVSTFGSASANPGVRGTGQIDHGTSEIQSSKTTFQHSAAGGNLSLPQIAPAAHVVAHALDVRARATKPGHAIRDIPTH